jgi:hypothetical protein
MEPLMVTPGRNSLHQGRQATVDPLSRTVRASLPDPGIKDQVSGLGDQTV